MEPTTSQFLHIFHSLFSWFLFFFVSVVESIGNMLLQLKSEDTCHVEQVEIHQDQVFAPTITKESQQCPSEPKVSTPSTTETPQPIMAVPSNISPQEVQQEEAVTAPNAQEQELVGVPPKEVVEELLVESGDVKKKRSRRGKRGKATEHPAPSSILPDSKERQTTPKAPKQQPKAPKQPKVVPSDLQKTEDNKTKKTKKAVVEKENLTVTAPSPQGPEQKNLKSRKQSSVAIPDLPQKKFSHSMLLSTMMNPSSEVGLSIRPIRQPLGPLTNGSIGFSQDYQRSRKVVLPPTNCKMNTDHRLL